MKKLKKLWPLFLSLVVVLVLAVIAFSQPSVILFYKNDCPHCQKVEEYLKEHPSKVKYRFLEAVDNQQNYALLIKKAKSCGLSEDSLEAPFLYDGQHCLVGDQAVIDWFSKQ